MTRTIYDVLEELETDFRDLKNSINGLIGEETNNNYQLLTAEQATKMIENHIIENLKELIEELKKWLKVINIVKVTSYKGVTS